MQRLPREKAENEMKEYDQRLIEYVVAAMAAMSMADRVEVFDMLQSEFCKYCGSADGPRCQCWNDE